MRTPVEILPDDGAPRLFKAYTRRGISRRRRRLHSTPMSTAANVVMRAVWARFGGDTPVLVFAGVRT